MAKPPPYTAVDMILLQPGAPIQMPLAQIFGPVPAADLAKGCDLKYATSTPTPPSAGSYLAGVRGRQERADILACAIVGVVKLGCFQNDIVIAILRR